MGGDKVRVRLTNEFGKSGLRLGGARFAVIASDGNVGQASDFPLLFHGKRYTTIPAQSFVISDEVRFRLPPLSIVSVRIYLPPQTLSVLTCHEIAASTNFISRGDALRLNKEKLATTSWHLPKGVDVLADAQGNDPGCFEAQFFLTKKCRL